MKVQNGYTILELLIIVMVVIIIATVTAPSLMRAYASVKLNALAQEISYTMSGIRNSAVCGVEGYYCFIFARFGDSSSGGSPACYIQRGDFTTPPVKRIVFPKGISLTHFTFTDQTIRFSRVGAPIPSGGTIGFRNAYGKTKYIVVMPATGRIVVRDYP